MWFFRFLVACGLLLIACAVGAQTPAAQVYVSDGRTQKWLGAGDAPEVERALRAMLASCTVDASAAAGTPERWHAAEQGPAIFAIHPAPIRVRTPSGELEVDALLFAPRTRDHVLARSGERVYAFSKWRPELEAALVCKPQLDLQRDPEIRKLCTAAGASGPPAGAP